MKSEESKEKGLSRRRFLKCTGTIVFAMGSSGYLLGGCGTTKERKTIAPSQGYLVVDVEKCQGCISCMLACSLVHEGVHSPTLSRIQILQDSFGKFPEDLDMAQCRQCETPACVDACPEEALYADTAFGYVRRVNKERCTGCGSCFQACPYTPARLSVTEDDASTPELKSRKCDLCANAPYHWDEKGGGPEGLQACVAVCPVGAIAFTTALPVQEGDAGYKVNLRDDNWARLGYQKS
jgi:protein NrfC